MRQAKNNMGLMLKEGLLKETSMVKHLSGLQQNE